MREIESSTTQFEILHCIGRGGFGEVYRGVMVTPGGLRSDVAIKMLKGDALLNEDAVARFRDEATVLAALKHRAILRVHDVVQVQGRVAMISEFIEGADLQQLQRLRRLPLRAAIEVTGEVAGALEAAWNSPTPGSGRPLRLVHRDIKPANIRIAKDGGVKLLDFGVARSEEMQREAHTSTGLLVGTMGYLAPERLTEDHLAPPSDIFALGCVLFHMVCGEKFFDGVTRSEWVAMAFRREDHDGFLAKRIDGLDRSGNPSCDPAPEAVRGLLLDLLAYDAERRPTAVQLVERCEELAESTNGESLRRFTRQCEWPAEEVLGGELSGQHVSEMSLMLDSDLEMVVAGSPTGSEASLADPVTSTSVTTKGLLVGGFLSMGMGIAGLVVVLAVAGVLAWQNWQAASVAEVDAPEEVVAPEPAPTPAPVEVVPEPVPEEEVVPEPAPAVPEAAPRPAPTARGKVRVDGVASATLVGGGRKRSPGAVPAGTYTLVVTFDNYGEVTVPKPLVVGVGDEIVVTCVSGFFTCKW